MLWMLPLTYIHLTCVYDCLVVEPSEEDGSYFLVITLIQSGINSKQLLQHISYLGPDGDNFLLSHSCSYYVPDLWSNVVCESDLLIIHVVASSCCQWSTCTVHHGTRSRPYAFHIGAMTTCTCRLLTRGDAKKEILNLTYIASVNKQGN